MLHPRLKLRFNCRSVSPFPRGLFQFHLFINGSVFERLRSSFESAKLSWNSANQRKTRPLFDVLEQNAAKLSKSRANRKRLAIVLDVIYTDGDRSHQSTCQSMPYVSITRRQSLRVVLLALLYGCAFWLFKLSSSMIWYRLFICSCCDVITVLFIRLIHWIIQFIAYGTITRVWFPSAVYIIVTACRSEIITFRYCGAS